MYTQQGYRDTPRFNHSTLAEIWIEGVLVVSMPDQIWDSANNHPGSRLKKAPRRN